MGAPLFELSSGTCFNQSTGMISKSMNSAMPEIGAALPHDGSSLARLLTLATTQDGCLVSAHAESNINGNIFGGQLLGQAVSAAIEGLPEDLSIHCLQLTFLAPGKAGDDLLFRVQPLLNGRNFSIRQVQCTQRERLVFSAQVSFHRGEVGPEHGDPMPEGIPAPESLPTVSEVALANRDRLQLDEDVLAQLGVSSNLEIRPVRPTALLLEREPSGRVQYWIRARGRFPDAPRLHHAALSYLSDYWFPIATLAPHMNCKFDTGLYIASLNHTVWFHAPVRADEWLLFDTRSHRATSGRGFVQASVYRQDGGLVASVAQETLFRGWSQLHDRAPTL